MRRLLSAILTLLVLPACTRQEQPVRTPFQPQPRSVALVVDTSASMRTSDANRLAILASRIFVDLLSPEDRVSVLTFPSGKDVVKPKGGLTRPADFTPWILQKTDILCGHALAQCPGLGEQIESIAYDARFTVFQEPLAKAMSAAADGTGNRAIVFLTDGMTDRWDRGAPDPAQHQAELNALNERAAALQRERVRFFGITFHEADREQFKALAGRTHGHAAHVNSAADLTREFINVVSRILETQVETLTLSPGETMDFQVRPFVREVSLLFVGQQRLAFEALEPRSAWWRLWEERRHFRAGDTCAELCVLSRTSGDTPYTIIKLKNPRAGIWKFRTDSAATPLIIQDLDLHLDVNGAQEGWVGETNTLPARLVTSRGEVVADPKFLSQVKFSLQVRDDKGAVTQEASAGATASGQAGLAFVPRSEAPATVQVEATNQDWLTRRLTLPFRAVKDIRLNQAGVPQLAVHTPYTDAFLETLGGLLPDRLWKPGTRRTCAPVSFAGSAPQARSVRFHFDDASLPHGVRLVNADGEPWFSLDARDQATLCIETRRSTPGGSFLPLRVPVRASSGREIAGARTIDVNVQVERLPLHLRVFPLWLLFEMWLGWRLFTLLLFWWLRLFTPAVTLEFRGGEGRTGRGRRVRTVARFHPAPWFFGTAKIRSRALAWLAFLLIGPLQALALALVCPLRTLLSPGTPVGNQPCHRADQERRKPQRTVSEPVRPSLPRRLLLALADYAFGLNLSGQSWTIRHEKLQATWLLTGVVLSRRILVHHQGAWSDDAAVKSPDDGMEISLE